jgi:choline-sulfatase
LRYNAVLPVACIDCHRALSTSNGIWDNALMYDGRFPTWHHRLRDAGICVTAIGKLHYRSGDDDNGFSEEIDTMHVVDGIGSPLTQLRATEDGVPRRGGHKAIYADTGPGQADYQIYDQRITEQTVQWLKDNADNPDPWVLVVSYPSPHPPFRAVEDIMAFYPEADMPLPPTWNADDRLDHPAMAYLAWMNQLTDGISEEFARKAYAGYCGLITHTDREIGKVMDAAEALGLMGNTRLMYTSDHGEAITAHGILGRANLYEHSVGVPLLACGPGLPSGKVVDTCASHVDLFPTMTAMFGLDENTQDSDLFGLSLLRLADGELVGRKAFAEYHAMGSKSSSFMLRNGQYKLIYHVSMPLQLFDLKADPFEQFDLLADGNAHPVKAEMLHHLRALVDPEHLDTRSKSDQRARMDALGGEDAVRNVGSIAASPIPGKPVKLERI